MDTCQNLIACTEVLTSVLTDLKKNQSNRENYKFLVKITVRIIRLFVAHEIKQLFAKHTPSQFTTYHIYYCSRNEFWFDAFQTMCVSQVYQYNTCEGTRKRKKIKLFGRDKTEPTFKESDGFWLCLRVFFVFLNPRFDCCLRFHTLVSKQIPSRVISFCSARLWGSRWKSDFFSEQNWSLCSLN